MIQSHWLKCNHENRLPKRVVCLDTETQWPDYEHEGFDTFHEWRIGVARFARFQGTEEIESELMMFDCPGTLWAWIFTKLHKREKLWIFAHNAIFDLTISKFWDLCETGVVQLSKWVISDPPTIIDGTVNGCKLKIVDSMNWLTMPLANIGTMVGLEKLPMPNQKEHDAAWYEYCIRDVAILAGFVKMLIKTIGEYDLGNFQATAAGQSMSAFRHRWMSKDSILIHDDANANRLERASYFGGKVHCFRVGKFEDCYHVDVSNLYPFVMAREEYPSQLVCMVNSPPPAALLAAVQRYLVIANVELLATDDVYPVRQEGVVTYATGRFWTTLAGPELVRAMSSGAVHGCSQMAVYKRGRIFERWGRDWLAFLRAAKQSGNLGLYKLVKVFANALSGKWAQRLVRWNKAEVPTGHRAWGEWWRMDYDREEWTHYRAIAGCVQYECELVDSANSFPAISAFITSYGRLYMDVLRSMAGVKNVYYQDTDGFIVTAEGVENLIRHGVMDKDDPGKMRVDKRYETVDIQGLRRLVLNGKMSTPGVKASAVEVTDGVFLQDAWQGGVMLLNRNPDGAVPVSRRKVGLLAPRIGASVGPDGWTVPYVLQ